MSDQNVTSSEDSQVVMQVETRCEFYFLICKGQVHVSVALVGCIEQSLR
jgi:hypothetical protein